LDNSVSTGFYLLRREGGREGFSPLHSFQTFIGAHPPPSIDRIGGDSSLRVKFSENVAEDSPLSSAEIYNAWSFTSTSFMSYHDIFFRCRGKVVDV
jgi:hypothetical protein